MSDLSPQTGAKRTLIRSRGAFALAAGRERALDANLIESLDFGQAARQPVDRAAVALTLAPSPLPGERTRIRIERGDARTCSTKCRVKLHRRKRFAEGEHAPTRYHDVGACSRPFRIARSSA
jgi:hypothetical protein